MDKYEYKVRTEEIKELIAQRDYAHAAEIADTIDWRRVKSVMMLCTISDLYKINRRYEDSRDLLLLAYDRHPGGRTIVYALCELSVKMDELPQAVEYCKEFVNIAPRDPGRYILQYKIYEAQGVSLEERIEVLEELKKHDYREKWAYELAYLYHRIGLASKCVDECDEMIVWFGDGKYVIKAMELKMLHQPLTPEQQWKYDKRFAPVEEEAPIEESQPQEATVIEEIPQSFYQEQESGTNEEQQGTTAIWSPQEVAVAMEPLDADMAETKIFLVEEIDIQVKTMDPGNQYNTINLQAEVAAGIKELLEQDAKEEITRETMAPMMETDSLKEATKVFQAEEIVKEDETSAVGLQEGATMVWSKAEVMGVKAMEEPKADTREIPSVGQNVMEENAKSLEDTFVESDEVLEETVEDSVENPEALMEPEESVSVSADIEPKSDSVEKVVKRDDVTAKTVMEQMRKGMGEPSPEMAKVLSMDADGQITFIMPEKEAIEKQITGQLCFEDIMAEWERMKKDLEEKGKEKIRQHVKENTGQMFNEFEASVRDGLLEQLEGGRSAEAVIAEAEGMGAEDDIPVPLSLMNDADDVIVDEEAAVNEVQIVYEEQDYMEESLEEPFEEEEEPEGIMEAEEEETAVEETLEYEPEETAEELFEEEEESEGIMEAEEEETAAEETLEYEPEETAEELFEEEEEPEGIMEAEEEETAAEETLEYEPEEITEEPFEEEEKPEEAEESVEEVAIPEEIEQEEKVEEKPARKKIKIRNLTKEERELFGPYIQSRSTKAQLIHAIDNLSMAAYTGNLIITGAEGLDTLGLAKNIIKEVQMTDSNFSGKIAKISGESLNKRNASEVLKGLQNGALIIQKAYHMNEQTVNQLYRALQQENSGIIVIVEGVKKFMNLFLSRNSDLKNCFTARIDMEALSDAALVAFCKKYAREKEFSIDEMAVLALHEIITERQTSDHAVTIMEVKEIMDDAMERAGRRSIGHFFDILSAKRYDDEDMIIIREKDFMY